MVRTRLDNLFGALVSQFARVSRPTTSTRWEHVFLHARPTGHPKVELHVPRFDVTDEDLALTQRLVAAFERACVDESGFANGEQPTGDLWHKIRNESQCELIEALLRHDIAKAAEILTNALHHDVAKGLSQDIALLGASTSFRDQRRVVNAATKIVDRFVAFAEALGVLLVEFPEWGRWGENIYAELADLYERVEQAAGLTLGIPECFGLHGVRAGKHVIHTTTAPHAYAAWRMGQVLRDVTKARVCEIGAGFGGCAYYFAQRPIGRYTLIDLPLTNVLQGFFLAKTCGPDNVRLYGEPDDGQRLQILPYWKMEAMPDRCFDLVLSQESLPEIQRDKAEAYVAQIARTSRYFLSINQETAAGVGFQDFQHNVVPELVVEHGGFERLYRFPYWLRKGQVEELYQVR